MLGHMVVAVEPRGAEYSLDFHMDKMDGPAKVILWRTICQVAFIMQTLSLRTVGIIGIGRYHMWRDIEFCL